MLRTIFLIVILSIFSFVNAEPVNINTASAEELAKNLNGVGPKKALAIIEYRETNGPFFTPKEIINVKGIGPKTFEKNQKDIIVRN